MISPWIGIPLAALIITAALYLLSEHVLAPLALAIFNDDGYSEHSTGGAVSYPNPLTPEQMAVVEGEGLIQGYRESYPGGFYPGLPFENDDCIAQSQAFVKDLGDAMERLER